MKNKIIYSALLIGLLFTGCSGAGIFYTLNNEEKIADNTLANEVMVSGMFRSGTDYLVNAGGSLFNSTAGTSSTWAELNSYTDSSDSTIYSHWISVVDFNGEWWASAANTAGTQFVILHKNAGDADWSESSLSTDQCKLHTAGNLLIIEKATSDGYEILFSTDGSSLQNFTTSSQDLVLHTPLAGAVINGTDLYLADEDAIYSGTSGTAALTSITGPTLASGENFTSLNLQTGFDSTSVTLLLTSDIGYIYYTTDNGGNWNTSAQLENTSGEEIKLLSSLFIDVAGTRLLLTGTESNGYYEWADFDTISDDNDRILTDSVENYTTSDLANASVADFYLDESTTNTLFALTAGNGLWKNPLADLEWNIE